MLTVITALLYAQKHKALENRLVVGKKEENVANLFLISSGRAKRQLTGHMISEKISDKLILSGSIILDCVVGAFIFFT